jgi:hypothetical protein
MFGAAVAGGALFSLRPYLQRDTSSGGSSSSTVIEYGTEPTNQMQMGQLLVVATLRTTIQQTILIPHPDRRTKEQEL